VSKLAQQNSPRTSNLQKQINQHRKKYHKKSITNMTPLKMTSPSGFSTAFDFYKDDKSKIRNLSRAYATGSNVTPRGLYEKGKPFMDKRGKKSIPPLALDKYLVTKIDRISTKEQDSLQGVNISGTHYLCDSPDSSANDTARQIR